MKATQEQHARIVRSIDAEIRQSGVAIVPILPAVGDGLPSADRLGQGSGTCITIAGRFFVATAAHVVLGFPETRYFVLTPTTEDLALKVIGGGRRGGRNGERHDVAWLELSPGAARAAQRRFLTLDRLSRYVFSKHDRLAVYGAPAVEQERGERNGLPSLTTHASTYFGTPLEGSDVSSEDADRLCVEWLRLEDGTNGESVEKPEPHGLSGGGIWAPNVAANGEAWTPDMVRLVGIEFAVKTGRGRRYLVGDHIDAWLDMVAEQVPELAPEIRPHLAGTRLLLASRPAPTEGRSL
jgi:hypothetical protein